MQENSAFENQTPPKRAMFEMMSGGGKFSLLMFFFFLGLIISNILGALAIIPFLNFKTEGVLDLSSILKQLGNYSDRGIISGLKIAQAISAIGTFILPAFIFTFLITRKKASWMKIDSMPMGVSIVMCILIILSIQPLIGLTGEWNANMQLPEFLSGVEKWMKESESAMAELTKAFLKMEDVTDVITNILIIALLAAVGEELFFRGCMQRVLIGWIKNPHVGIWITALVFSALHFQFYGFLPRMLIGAVLGYLFFWSGSLWLPIIGHFTNNALAVILSYLVQNKVITEQVENIGADDGQGAIVFSSVLLLMMWLIMLYRFEKTKPRKLTQ